MILPGRLLLAVFFCVFSLSEVSGQKVIQGTVRDAETLAPLPAANIQIQDTYKGTISNNRGEFILRIDHLPATVIFSYIGYATEKIRITRESETVREIFLTPISYQLEPIVVTGEDPAVRIMREVIKRKQQWRKSLQTFRAEAYTRLVLENDTAITSIMESLSIAFWHKEKGIREVIQSKRQTSNISEEQNFASASTISNLYDDDIEIAGFNFIGVTHPDALRQYRFTLVDRRQIDDRVVFDISVSPRNKLQPTFTGKISVLDQEFALLEVDLKPSDAVLFPPPIQEFNLHYQQQFNNFGTKYWLPMDVRVNGSIRIGIIGLSFPRIIIKRITRLTNYEINVPLPDSLYRQPELWITDSSRIEQDTDSLFAENPEVVPFSPAETKAYTQLDSTMTLQKAFRPTGPLARFVEIETGNGTEGAKEKSVFQSLISNVKPQAGFDRVNELTIGVRTSFQIVNHLHLSPFAGYTTGQDRWYFGGNLSAEHKRFIIRLHYSQNSAFRYHSKTYPALFSSIHTLAGYPDYFDYYWHKSGWLEMSYRFPKFSGTFSMQFRSENSESLEKTTDYNILGRDIMQRINPGISEGTLRSIQVKWTLGQDFIPFGMVGQNRLEFTVEHSSPDFLSSDFNFTRYRLGLDLRIPTFLRRRLLPNVLDLHLMAGTFEGNLPLQRFGILDGALQFFAPYPVFKSRIGQPYEGEKYLGIFWEHNFRTVPLELIGWRSLAKRNIGIILHGSSGRTWISEERLLSLGYTPAYIDRFHHEIGFSINGIFQLLRFDFTWRLDRPDVFAGLVLARMF